MPEAGPMEVAVVSELALRVAPGRKKQFHSRDTLRRNGLKFSIVSAPTTWRAASKANGTKLLTAARRGGCSVAFCEKSAKRIAFD
jgi:hypothetical protein